MSRLHFVSLDMTKEQSTLDMTGRVHSYGKVVRASGAYPHAPAERAARPYRLLPLILHDKYTLRSNDSGVGHLARLSGHHIHAV